MFPSGTVRDAAQSLIELARVHATSLGCAESCTGGLVGGALTAIPGSSEVVRGSIVSYDPAVKHDVLGVDQAVIDDVARGVVSEDCARQMCEGAARVLKAQLTVSVTGIAGPGGAEPGKPVGTVWFGCCAWGVTHAECCHFEGNRDEVREAAVRHALGMMHEALVKRFATV